MRSAKPHRWCPAIPDVRAALLAFQRNFAIKPPGAVLDGRDIGTVICPHADVKLFVTATPQVRAQRRVLEIQGRGEKADEAAILADILRRDERDTRAPRRRSSRRRCPLLDTTALDANAAFQAAVELVERLRRK